MGVKLSRLMMHSPGEDFIYAPCDEKNLTIELTQEEFNKIVDTAESTLVSLEDDKISNPQQITSYTVHAHIKLKSGKVVKWPGSFIIK